MKNNTGIIMIGAAAAAYFLLGSKKSSAKSNEATPELRVGDVVDAGTLSGGAYEWRVVVDSLSPGFGSGAMFRGEWKKAGGAQWTVASGDSGPSSFDSPTDAKNNAMYAAGLFEANANPDG